MLSSIDDTIAAIASASGGGTRGIVRLSGPAVQECLEKCFRPLEENEVTRTRFAGVASGECIVDRRPSGESVAVPCDLYLWPTARSYTRQPTAELHTVGSPPLVNAVLRAVCRAGARLARPGEFTLRAFMAGRIDLTQAEAVLGVVDAENAEQLQTALRQMAGGLSRPLERLREDLLELLAELEAGLDFADEEIEFIGRDAIAGCLNETTRQISALALQLQSRDETRSGVRAILIGPPNAGKSSLFNAMITRHVSTRQRGQPAIVSPQSGTTRDYLAARLDLDGVVCELIDTAGICSEYGMLDEEVIGFERLDVSPSTSARQAVLSQCKQADIVIHCEPADVGAKKGAGVLCTRFHSSRSDERLLTPFLPWISVRTKGDLFPQTKASSSIITSIHTGEGLAELANAIRRAAETKQVPSGAAVAATAARCCESLEDASESLCRATAITNTNQGDELIASEVRSALTHLGEVVGAVYTENILDRIFSNFCLGK